jgi:hypothetical protein
VLYGPSKGILDCFDLDFADGPKALRESGFLDHMTTGFLGSSAKVRIPVCQECQPRGIHYDGKRLNGTRLKCNSGAAMDLPSCSHTKRRKCLAYRVTVREAYRTWL